MADSTTARLHESQRLMLVLDLDHTLLHAVDDKAASELFDLSQRQQKGELGDMLTPHQAANLADVHQIRVGGQLHHVKFRPGLQGLLNACKPLFDMYVYTQGTRPYADAVLEVLDPDNSLFQRRAITRSSVSF